MDNLDLVLMACRTSRNAVTGHSPRLLFSVVKLKNPPCLTVTVTIAYGRRMGNHSVDSVECEKASPVVDVPASFRVGERVLVRLHVRNKL